MDQRDTAAQRRRADQPCGECGVYELERRRNPPSYSRRTRSRRDPRRDPDGPEDRVTPIDPYVQPWRTHSVGRSEGSRGEAGAQGTSRDSRLRQDENRRPMEYGVGRVPRDRPGVDRGDHRRESPGLHQRRTLAQAGGVPQHRRRCVDHSHVRAGNTPAHPDGPEGRRDDGGDHGSPQDLRRAGYAGEQPGYPHPG